MPTAKPGSVSNLSVEGLSIALRKSSARGGAAADRDIA